jgi:hypothetical protein
MMPWNELCFSPPLSKARLLIAADGSIKEMGTGRLKWVFDAKTVAFAVNGN